MISVKIVPREKRSCTTCKHCSLVDDQNRNFKGEPDHQFDIFYCAKDDELQYRENENLARTHCRKWEPENLEKFLGGVE